eukprot:JZ553116.1.p2 GENE.JZ553116.1~~JZ553116.1.p2  ORF type:complete len:223 (+),score=96.14 JZ553116.1:3-671(+)
MPANPSKWLMERFDRARKVVGAPAAFAAMDAEVRKQLEEDIADEATKLAKDKMAGIPDSLDGCTIVVEFARGGSETMTCPIPAPFGYQYSLAKLSPEILRKAAMLYIWVTPEQSRAKNQARCDPNDPGSILNHGVPEFVMRNDYGTDDLVFLLGQSDKPKTIKIEHAGSVTPFYLPVGILDNRQDYTTFARSPVDSWKLRSREAARRDAEAMDDIAATYFKQ